MTMRSDEELKADVEVVRGARVLFGHQSVGANLLAGLKELTEELGVAPVRVLADPGPGAGLPEGGVFAHLKIGRNGDPASKFEAFLAAAGSAASRYDVVAMKLCYADFDASSDPARVFDGYRGVVAGIRANPAAPVVLHVSTPLRTVTPAWKRTLKSLLGRPADTSQADNAKRTEYSALLRQAYPGEPLFDLAAVESGPSASAPVLLDHYTDDGGHLNATGRAVASRAFIQALAGAVRAARTRAPQ
jgi:hypothetical protein